MWIASATPATLRTRYRGRQIHFQPVQKVRNISTSVEPGSIPSLAFNLAPLASCISLIFEPCFPITEPMRELGIMNLMVTARLPGTDGTSNGSSLMRRTMSPKALSR